jgi:hypothetical protein
MGRVCVRDFKPLGRLLPWVVCGLLGGDGNDTGPAEPGEGALEVITSTTGVAAQAAIGSVVIHGVATPE